MARRTATRGLNQPTGPLKWEWSMPEHWSPRGYQLDVTRSMPANASTRPEMTRDRLLLCWHRRAGKDLTCLALTSREMARRVGYYVHIFPDLKQGRPIIWDGKDGGGIPYLSRFPGIDFPGAPNSPVLQKNETELQVVFKPFPGQPGYGVPGAQGSVWQLRGANEPNTLRGPNYVGVVFSEFSEMDPYVWTAIIQPVLEENGGWAIFNFTPKGRNHAFIMYEMARTDPRWYCSLLTIGDTKRDGPGENGNVVVSEAQIEQLRKEGVPEDQIQQEYYCSFTGFLHGTIFGDLITQARKDQRIGKFPWLSNLPVGICADIGRTDATALWFYQRIGQQIVFIDYFENSLKGADFYAKVISEKPYLISRFILPHDARVKGFTAVESPEQYFSRMFRGVQVAPKLGLQTGIDMTRRIFSRCYFDANKCARGIECLENYRRKWNDELHDYSGEPLHDEFSHGADGFRTGAQGGMDEPLEFSDSPDRNPTHQDCEMSIFDEPREMIQ